MLPPEVAVFLTRPPSPLSLALTGDTLFHVDTGHGLRYDEEVRTEL